MRSIAFVSVACAFVVLVGCGAGGGGDSGGGPPAPTFGSISGLVTDSLSDPVGAADVYVNGQYVGVTDSGGSFFVSNVPTGVSDVRVTKSGYQSINVPVTVSSNVTSNTNVPLVRESLPVAYAVNPSMQPGYSPTSAVISMDIMVTDSNGNALSSLNASDFEIDGFVGDGTSFSFTQSGVTWMPSGSQVAQSFSAMMMFDQSGSISSTDPTDARVFAGKTFLNALGSSNEARVGAFASGGSLPFDPITVYGNDYNTDGASLALVLNDFPNLEAGNTPLYDASISAVGDVSQNGTRPKKVVILFTDGVDTSSTASLDDAIDFAVARGVSIFTVGLSNGVDREILLELAVETNGAYLEALDARQLVSYYKSLGGVLERTADIYRAVWLVNLSGGSYTFQSGGWFSTTVAIETQAGTLYAPFRIPVP